MLLPDTNSTNYVRIYQFNNLISHQISLVFTSFSIPRHTHKHSRSLLSNDHHHLLSSRAGRLPPDSYKAQDWANDMDTNDDGDLSHDEISLWMNTTLDDDGKAQRNLVTACCCWFCCCCLLLLVLLLLLLLLLVIIAVGAFLFVLVVAVGPVVPANSCWSS